MENSKGGRAYISRRCRRWIVLLLIITFTRYIAKYRSLLPEPSSQLSTQLLSPPSNRTGNGTGQSPKGVTCYIRSPMWHGHFPHHFEKIVQCWQLVYAAGAPYDDGCVYAFGRRPLSAYGKQIMSLLNFRPSFTRSKPIGDAKTDVTEIPSGLGEENFTWFRSVDEASAFRRMIIPDVPSPYEFQYSYKDKGNGNVTGDVGGNGNSKAHVRRIRIGFVQRKKSRHLENMELIRSIAEVGLASLVHETNALLRTRQRSQPELETYEYELTFSPTAYMEHLPVRQQATYYASHHIILSPHGAGTINAAFLHPGCVVIEAFPTNYALIYYFQTLVEQVGGSYLYWYNGTAVAAALNTDDGERRFGMVDRSVWKRDFDAHVEDFVDLKQANVTPPVEDIYHLLVLALRHVLDVAER